MLPVTEPPLPPVPICSVPLETVTAPDTSPLVEPLPTSKVPPETVMLPDRVPLVVVLPTSSVPAWTFQFWLPLPVTIQVAPPTSLNVVKPVNCVPIVLRLKVPVPLVPPN